MTLRIRNNGNILYTDLVAKFEKKDLRFLSQCKFISQDSKDPSTKTGALIVRPDNTVASQGYNGFPKQMPDYPEWLNDRKEKYSRIIHCEMNALLHAREPVHGYTLYTWPCISCDRCLVHLAQAGIGRFVFPTPTDDMLSRWKDFLEQAERYLSDMNLKWTEYPYEEVK